MMAAGYVMNGAKGMTAMHYFTTLVAKCCHDT